MFSTLSCGMTGAVITGVLEPLLVAGAIVALYPSRATVVGTAVLFCLLSLATLRFDGGDCGHVFHLVPNPYLVPELVAVVVLAFVAARWHRLQPKPVRAVRRLAIYAAGLVAFFTGALLLEPAEVECCAHAVLGGASLLAACLLIEIHRHVTPLPLATASEVRDRH